MSEFSPTEKEIFNDHQQEAFLSDDEGNSTYFVQRYMEVDRGHQTFSPEQYENMINTSKEFEQKSHFKARHSSKIIKMDEEIVISTPHRTKSRLHSTTDLDAISMLNFKPTDYTYARSCTYRRSSPTEKKLNNPVLKRKSLRMALAAGLNRAETFFYQSDAADDELRHTYDTRSEKFASYKTSKPSWFMQIYEWFTRKKVEIFTSINGVPPQFKNQRNFEKIEERKRISVYVNEIFLYFWLICTSVWSIFESLILRAKNVLTSGKKSSSNGGTKIMLANDGTATESESEIAVKEIHRVITEEIVVDEQFAKDTESSPSPKRSTFYWPCLLCFVLPLLFCLPLCFMASKPENNSTLYNYSMFIWQRCFVPSPILSVSNENPVVVEKIIDQEILKKYELHLLELQNRIAALEGANVGASIDLENFRKKLIELAGESTALKDLSGKINLHLNDMIDFRTKLKSLEDAQEQTLWQSKLASIIAAHDKRNEQLNVLREKIESLAKAECNCSHLVIGETGRVGINLDDVNVLIATAIAKYDADKTGLADYALEPAGGAVISIRCSKTYYPYTRKISWWNFPLGYEDYSPRTVIQPGLAPGECWAFTDMPGYLVIKLSWTIQVTAVSYEHIPRSISPDGRIDSAPKRMEIYGLQSEYDEKPALLGQFIYDDHGTPLQYFPVQATDAPPVPFVELRITSNHGHPVYTCMYRFRVHGRIVKGA